METKGIFRLTTFLVILIAGLSGFGQSLSAQEVSKTKPNKPDVKIKVNREYDNKGNVTRYDSIYSYSWSGDGDIPSDVDSILRGFNQHFYFKSGNDLLLNEMGFGDLFQNDPFFSQPFSNFNRQFDEFFRNNGFPNDSLNESNPQDMIGKDFNEIIKQHQRRMEQLIKQHQNFMPIIPAPEEDTLSSKKLPKERTRENQNFNTSKKREKLINV